MLLCCGFSCTCKKWFIFLIFKSLTCKLFKYSIINTLATDIFCHLAIFICRKFFSVNCLTCLNCKSCKNLIKKRFCHIISIAVCCLNLNICLIRVYTKCNVRWKCPRCCCPCQKICIFACNLETYYR